MTSNGTYENGHAYDWIVAVRFELCTLRKLELHLVLFAVAQIPAADIDGGFALQSDRQSVPFVV